MKKIASLLIAVIMVLSFSACTVTIVEFPSPSTTNNSITEVSLEEAVKKFREDPFITEFHQYTISTNGTIYENKTNKVGNVHTYGFEPFIQDADYQIYYRTCMVCVTLHSNSFSISFLDKGNYAEKEFHGTYVGCSRAFPEFLYRDDSLVYACNINLQDEPYLMASNVLFVVTPNYQYSSDAWAVPLFQMMDGSLKVYIKWKDKLFNLDYNKYPFFYTEGGLKNLDFSK